MNPVFLIPITAPAALLAALRSAGIRFTFTFDL